MTEPVDTFIAFTSDSWAIERTLRFFQASFWTASLIGPNSYVAQAAHSKAQIHLARRFYRACKWADCWASVFTAPESDYGALGALDDKLLSAWVEDLTGWPAGLYVIEHTAAVCWFYAILFTLVLAFFELVTTPSTTKPAVSEKGEKKETGKKVVKKNAKPVSPATRGKPTSAIANDLFTNSLDLLIPATAVGYIKLDPVYVSIGMATSSLITMSAIWRRIYAEKERAI